jgi:hypothetical protein
MDVSFYYVFISKADTEVFVKPSKQQAKQSPGHRVFQVLRGKQEGVEYETKFLEDKLKFKIC